MPPGILCKLSISKTDLTIPLGIYYQIVEQWFSIQVLERELGVVRRLRLNQNHVWRFSKKVLSTQNVPEFPGTGNWGSRYKVKKGLWVILPNLNPPLPHTDKGSFRLMDIQTPSSFSIPCNCHHHMWPKVRNFLFTPEEKRKNRGWQILWNGPNSEISPTSVSYSLLPFLLQLAFFRITLTSAMT